MLTQNLHTHTSFDDGQSTPREMAVAAVNAGLTGLGFSGHSPLPYENDWCLTEERLGPYKEEIDRLREEYRGRLNIWWGLELDGISQKPAVDFDYVIGSLHHLRIGADTPSVDDTAAVTADILSRYFDGDERAMIRAYFAQYGAMAADSRVDVVGHIDLLCKFSETAGLFPADDPFLLDCAARAMEPLVKAGKIVEVNTGAMAKGLRTQPYPSVPLLRILRDMGGRVTVTADAHSAAAVAHAFSETEALLRETGFREVWQFDGTAFVPVYLA